MKFSIKGQQTFENLWLGLMLANYPLLDMSTALNTCWHLNSATGRFAPRQNKTLSFEDMVMSYFQRARPECKNENFYTKGKLTKVSVSVFMDFFSLQQCVESNGLLFVNFSPDKINAFLSLKKLSNTAARKESSTF